MDGIGDKRQRLGKIAVGQLCADERQVQERADSEGGVKILGNMMVMAAVGMPMVVIMLMMPATTAVVVIIFLAAMRMPLMHEAI